MSLPQALGILWAVALVVIALSYHKAEVREDE